MINRGKLMRQKRWLSPQPKRGYRCKHCGSNDHYSFTCFKRPRKPIAQESVQYKRQRQATRKQWFKAKRNQPDENGQWDCYLKIAPDCYKRVNVHTISLEHVRAKTRHPALRFVALAIKPACPPCNKLKASWSLQELAETYSHIAKMIATSEWIAYERKLDQLEAKLEQKTTL